MGLLKDLFNNNNNNNKIEVEKPKIVVEEERSYFSDALNFNSISSYTSSSSMRLSAVYCAVNAISNAVAILPFNVYNVDTKGFKYVNYQHPLNNLLNVQPSKNLSKFNFFKLLVSSILLKGNAYAIIFKNQTGEITEIKYVHADSVTATYSQKTDTITYQIVGYPKPFASSEILHLWMYSNDAVNGISVINHAVNTLKIASDAENHSGKFFKSGAASNGILKANQTLTETQKQQIRLAWQSAFSDGSGNGVAIVPQGMDYQAISINSKDAQLLESRQYNVSEIARFFNISPTKLYDLTHSSYSSLEQTQLGFLSDTINPFLTLIEGEFNRKLFVNNQNLNTIKFNVSELLKTDRQATATYYKDLVNNGLMTINEARKELNLNDIEGGDELFMQLNMSTVNNLTSGITTTPEQQNLKQKTKKIIAENK